MGAGQVVKPIYRRITGFISAADNMVYIDGIKPYLMTNTSEQVPRINLGFKASYISLNVWPKGANPTDWNVGMSAVIGEGLAAEGKVATASIPLLHQTADTMGTAKVQSVVTSLATGLVVRQGVATWGASGGLYFEVIASYA